MAKYFYFLFISISISSSLFSQEANIATEFSQDGVLYKGLENTSQSLTPFTAEEKCSVLEYLGKDKYKVRYNELVGVVDSQYLVINEDMMDLFYAFQERERMEAIKAEEARKRKIQEIIRKNSEERQEDSPAKIKEDVHMIISKDEDKIRQRKQQDSIVKIIEEEKRNKAAQELARKNQEHINERRLEDSIAKVKEGKKRQQELQELARKKKEEISEKRRKDSIARVKEDEKRQQEFQELERRDQEKINTKRKEDSIAKVKEEEKKQLELQELARKKKEEISKKRQQDSVAKIIEEEKSKKAIQELAIRNQEYINAKRREDSIIQIKESEKKQQELQELAIRNQEYINTKRQEDSIAKVIEEEKKQQETQGLTRKMQEQLKKREEINVSRREDSIAKIIEEEKSKEAQQELVKENEKEIEEREEFRDSCHYLMNEYDETYNVRTIKTDPYRVSKNLTIELYEYGQNRQVFFNLSQDLGCASYLLNNRSYVKVTLENDRVVTFYHFWDIDCGNFSLKGRLSNSQIMILEKSPIKSIRFQGTKDHYEMADIDYKEFFMDKLKCLD